MNAYTRYDITKIANPLFSYFQTIVPKNKHEVVKFINSVIINTPYLVGIAKRFGAVMAGEVDYAKIKREYASVGYTDSLNKKLTKVLQSMKFSKKQVEILFNLFMYPEVVATVMPLYEYKVQCRSCFNEIILSDSRDKHFEFTMRVKDVVKTEGLQASFKCPFCDKSNNLVDVETVKIKATDRNPGGYIKVWNPYYAKVETGVITRRTFAVVDANRFREIYPDRMVNNGLFTYADIDNADPVFLMSMMAGNAYIPNDKFTMVFRNDPDIAGLETALSPLLLMIVSLLHTGALRRGQEADAIIKQSPNILISPAQGEGSAINTTMDSRQVTDMALQMVKEVQEGDSTGLMYFPSALKAESLFADPRRTILEKEIREEEMNTLFVTGLDASFFQGGAGVLNDPLLLHIFRELFDSYTDQVAEFSGMLLTFLGKSFFAQDSLPKDLYELPLVRIDKAPGTYIDKEYSALAMGEGGGLLPLTPMLAKYGFASLEEALKARMDEDVSLARIKRAGELKVMQESQQEELQNMANSMVTPQIISRVTAELLPQAEQMAQELSGMPEGQRKSELHRLQTNDMLTYALVSIKLRELSNMQTQQAKADTQMQQPQGGI